MESEGYIERLGTGTSDIFRITEKHGLREPVFTQDDMFKAILFRPSANQISGQVSGQVPIEIKKLIRVLEGEMKRKEIQDSLQLKHRDYFTENYIYPSINEGYIEMIYPETPKHPGQKYRLTEKGKSLKESL